MSEHIPFSRADQIYWMLPGPSRFIDSVSHAISHNRAVVVSAQGQTTINFWPAFHRALAEAHFEDEKPLKISVDDGTHIDSDVGLHLGRTLTSAAQLAALRQPRPQTIALLAKSAKAAEKCEVYLMAFAQAALNGKGNLRVVVARDGQEKTWPDMKGLLQVHFNGALTREEMNAYVAMRMLGRRGPGSTELLHQLVAEYAGFDVNFAEELMRLNEAEIMELPQTLSLVAHRMPISDAVWREGRVDTGASAVIAGKTQAHVLHEWHLACHPGPHQDAAYRQTYARYWRAALTALMPWLEARRHRVVDIMAPALQAHLAPTGGMKNRILPSSGRLVQTSMEELEYNEIVGLTRGEDPLYLNDPRQMAALDVCFRVKGVRDRLAHMQSPDSPHVLRLIERMDALLGA